MTGLFFVPSHVLLYSNISSEGKKKYVRVKQKVHPPGIEPGTYRVLGGRHNQLDHGCISTSTLGLSKGTSVILVKCISVWTPVVLHTPGSVAEWSKALDSSSSLFGGAGSNPA